MASAIVNKASLLASEGFLDPPTSAASFSSYGWLSPRISFSCEFSDDDKPRPPPTSSGDALGNDEDLDFEFIQVDDPVAMLPADELFSDGKLVPRQLAAVRPTLEASASSSLVGTPPAVGLIQSHVPEKTLQKAEEPSASDPYTAFSPKAPTCTGRWKELLRLRRTAQSAGATRPDAPKSSCKCSSSSSALAVAAASSSGTSATRSLKHLLHRNPRSSPSSADPDSDSVRRFSLPSSAADHDDHPRLSLDADRPGDVSISLCRNPGRLRLAPRGSPTADFSTRSHQGPRAGRPPTRRSSAEAPATRSSSVDSPRMNSSGKVVFQGLGRSSSSPSALHGGPRGKSHPASVVRVAPVLNVPVSVFGLGQLFSAPQKKDPAAVSSSSGAARSGGGGSSVGKAERA
ncbi:hypothetical protein Taro_030740 [Colocasia esculenta]|uniref:Uncharacterized protein n=1 Tax=Colocasia esculenta TaxID=4460 RepID=A0A843VN59_COLES|nr:hypothetical protein [Colocasia esculenta]